MGIFLAPSPSLPSPLPTSMRLQEHHHLPPPRVANIDSVSDSLFRSDPAPTLILPILVLFFFLLGFLTVFLLRGFLRYLFTVCVLRRVATDADHPAPASAEPGQPRGLPPWILESFPVFPYSSIRRLRRRRKCELVCAICLSEFGDDDSVRLLTACWHAFHPECIDLWLAAHATCPVCRCNLEKQAEDAPDDGHRISLAEEDGEEVDGEGSARERSVESHCGGPSRSGDRTGDDDGDDRGSDDDEYTLRLPEDVGRRLRYVRRGRGDVASSEDVASGG